MEVLIESNGLFLSQSAIRVERIRAAVGGERPGRGAAIAFHRIEISSTVFLLQGIFYRLVDSRLSVGRAEKKRHLKQSNTF
ncbi:hypothetical protein [Serratia plymuthica]|uniref:hypothetical protein n=1 Tax=Serratia plymuthica TaxID=82996 RepID=UPI0012FE7552|nr:hypothetical protein [Serratia plymuthica]